MISRSALLYMNRKGLRRHIVPSPGFDPSKAKVHRLPLDGDPAQAEPSQEEWLLHEGDPVPDRVNLPDWSTPHSSE
jgi:hypothetical protein